MPKREKLAEYFKKDIPDSLYFLGDIRKVSQSLIYQEAVEPVIQEKDATLDQTIHVAIRAAWFTLFKSWDKNDELDLETKDANLAGLLFHQNLPLYLEKAPFEVYEEILDYLRWSDRADFWAFFHQCWNLLPLSYRLKLKYPNLYLQNYDKPSVIPEPAQLQYTMVLTKQSALFNAWKEMNRVAAEHDIPFRCVTQWATHQKGKLYDTLGLKLESLSEDILLEDSVKELPNSVKVELQNSVIPDVMVPVTVVPAVSSATVSSATVVPAVSSAKGVKRVKSVSKPASVQKRVGRGKKVNTE
jgi:hypothetical protein